MNVPASGPYDIKAGTKRITTRGIFQLSVNGTNVGPTEDKYSANSGGVFQEYDLGNATFPAPATILSSSRWSATTPAAADILCASTTSS